MTQKCDLCADVCRGHGLGDDDSWKPEIGSRAYAETAMTQSIEEAAREAMLQAGVGRVALLCAGIEAGIKLGRKQAAEEIADLKSSVVAFAASWVGQYAKDHGFPDGHLHPTHYDILEKCGARLFEFTRADLP